jgi:magnesium transporter
MINTLFLPELREMLAEKDAAGLREFCGALHPARTAEYMAGLTPSETWEVLQFADSALRAEIISYIDRDRQVEMMGTQDRDQVAEVIAELASDDRVDILEEVHDDVVEDLLSRLPVDDRRDIMRLRQYPEGTAGAVMTSEFAKLRANLTVREALSELSKQAEHLETIYYLYIVDDEDHMRGLVSARQLVSSISKPDTKLSDLMETDLVTVGVMEDQEQMAHKVARLDLLAIPVVDSERRLVGIITHDDVLDVMREEATADAHLFGGVDPLQESYLKTAILTLCWKRGIWLGLLFFFALLTALALEAYDERLATWTWLVPFIPLVISSGGNSGSQSATLIITALAQKHISLKDWAQVVSRELAMGLILGGGLAAFGYAVAVLFAPSPFKALVIPITLLLVVLTGTLSGSLLPLIFKRFGLDPAMMSNPFVAGIVDILGILIYLNVAILFL